LLLLLVVHRPEAIFWVTGLVLCLGVFGLDFPYALFFEGKSAPAVAYLGKEGVDEKEKKRRSGETRTDDFGEGAVVGLDGARDVLLTDKVGAEEHERVGWTRYVAQGTTFTGWNAAPRWERRREVGRGEKSGSGRGGIRVRRGERVGLYEGAGGDVRSEGDLSGRLLKTIITRLNLMKGVCRKEIRER
jgi:hypothetical protein